MPIVGVGASAGGLEALEQFFRAVPADSGLAYVVIQHLSPDYKSLMVELLSKHTAMRVLRAEDGATVEADTVYLIPPKKNLTIFHGMLYLTEQDHGHSHGLNLPIDVFFRSLAEDQGEKAIGVVLSGTGSDGTLGIRAIKGAGGMVMAQDLATAKFDGMPRNAIATGLVDYVLPAEKMPEELLKFVKHPYVRKGDKIEEIILKEGDSLPKALAILRDRTGADFSYYKPNTIIRRIERRISINQLERIQDYIALLSQSQQEAAALYRDLLIGVTRFFRDTEAFDILRERLVPDLCDRARSGPPIRVWCAGCSTGEEPYSVAMLFKEHLDRAGRTTEVKIFATDLDREAIEYGSAGFYPESIIADVELERLREHFVKRENGYQIGEKIRRMVVFAPHNLITDPPFSKMDLVCCRNLLIYLQPATQKKALSSFHFALNRGAYLFLGSSESVGEHSSVFSVVDNKWKIYQFRDGVRPPALGALVSPAPGGGGNALRSSLANPLRPAAGDDALLTVYQGLIADYAPPTIVVDESHELVHVFGDVNRFMRIPAGRMTLNVLKLVPRELATAVSTILYKATKERKAVAYRDVQLPDKAGTRAVTVVAKPFTGERTKRDLIALVFEDDSSRKPVKRRSGKPSLEDAAQLRAHDLEQELQYTRENLQATIEELETANEELQSTNEELIASNEELQSTNEELQSVNEELYTVNSEYQKKIEELTILNNDILNLVKCSDVATVFLDQELLIRRYTPAATSVINVMDMDIGRPIHHITPNFDYPKFAGDIEAVLQSLAPRQTEIQTKDGRWFDLKIGPYRTAQNAVGGIVLTFVEVTERRAHEETLKRERDLLIRVLESSPVGGAMVDRSGAITFANRRAAEILGMNVGLLGGLAFDAPELRIRDREGRPVPGGQLPFGRILSTRAPLRDYVCALERPGEKRVLVLIHGAPIFDEGGEVAGAVFSIDDITGRDGLCLPGGRERSDG